MRNPTKEEINNAIALFESQHGKLTESFRIDLEVYNGNKR